MSYTSLPARTERGLQPIILFIFLQWTKKLHPSKLGINQAMVYVSDMSDPTVPKPPDSPVRPYNLDEIRFIREEVRFQHTLIGTRLSWFVSAQAFLVTPFAICISNQVSRTWPLAFVGIPFLGIALSLLIVQGIQQAIRRIEEQHMRMLTYDTDHLIGPPDPVGQTRSLRFATWTPWIFSTFWTVIILIGIFLFAMRH